MGQKPYPRVELDALGVDLPCGLRGEAVWHVEGVGHPHILRPKVEARLVPGEVHGWLQVVTFFGTSEVDWFPVVGRKFGTLSSVICGILLVCVHNLLLKNPISPLLLPPVP